MTRLQQRYEELRADGATHADAVVQIAEDTGWRADVGIVEKVLARLLQAESGDESWTVPGDSAWRAASPAERLGALYREVVREELTDRLRAAFRGGLIDSDEYVATTVRVAEMVYETADLTDCEPE